MYLLRLYLQADPGTPVSAHMLVDGTTRIGRDPAADWPIADPECEISRTHLEVLCDGRALGVRALGANGVYRAPGGERLPDGEQVPVVPGDAVSFGKYRMTVEDAPFAGQAGPRSDATMVFAAPFGETPGVPSDWTDAAPIPAMEDEDSLLEAFCEGAGLDVSALSGEASTEIMRRAGAMYRQMVLGLSDLMRERSATKRDLNMDRTTIGARDNNPLKWAPTRKLATGLLAGSEAGFLSGPDAVRGSFEDVKRHMLGSLAGFEAAMSAAVDLLSPERIQGQADGQSHFLKNRQALSWAEFEKAHALLARQIADNADGPLNQAFVQAYEHRLSSLDDEPGRDL